MAQTVKERMLEDMRRNCNHRGVVTLSPEALAKRHGLNGHDLAKNLDQLRTEGFLTFAWSHDRITRIRLNRGAINEAALASRGRIKALSVADRVIDYLVEQTPDADGWVKTTTRQIMDALGVGQQAQVAVSRLMHSGRLEAKTEGGRRTVVALRLGRGPSIAPRPEAKIPVPAIPPTPELDKYVAARRIALLAPEQNPYLTVSFEPNPIADEAMLLRYTLEALLKEQEK